MIGDVLHYLSSSLVDYIVHEGEPGESLDDGRVQLMRPSAEAGEIQNRS